MKFVDTRFRASTRYTIYVIFVLLVLATLGLGAISIQQSFTNFTHVGESVTELKYQLQSEISARNGDASVEPEVTSYEEKPFSEDYVKEENSQEINQE